MERINICDGGLDNLKNAIVIQAAEDYLYVKKLCYAFNRQPTKDEQAMVDDCIRFFHSEWYMMLCDMDGDDLLKKLDKHFYEWIEDTEEVEFFRSKHRNKKKESEEA